MEHKNLSTHQKSMLTLLSELGDVVFVQKDGNRYLLNDKAEIPLKTQVDAVLFFIQQLDSSMLKLVLDKNFTYQDYDLKTFIKKISHVFDVFLERENTFLNIHEGSCTSNVCCKSNCKGFSFIGNKSNDYMDLIIQIENDKVLDIYECYQFLNQKSMVLKKEKITIDSIEEPF